jgi:hypothetical protein
MDSLSETAAAFRERFDSIPMGGVSYEVLANAGEMPPCDDVCPVRMNYYPAHLTKDDAVVDFQKFEAPSHERLYVLDLIVTPGKEECIFVVRYSREHFTEAAIGQVVKRWVGALQSDDGVALIKDARSAGARGSNG